MIEDSMYVLVKWEDLWRWSETLDEALDFLESAYNNDDRDKFDTAFALLDTMVFDLDVLVLERECDDTD